MSGFDVTAVPVDVLDQLGRLQHVSLFSGVDGIGQGLAQHGVPTVLLCEYDKHARDVLRRHYQGVPIHNDIRELTADDLHRAGAEPERTIVSAGFPCQDLSVAGGRRGMGEGTRSGLYWHVDRLLAEFRPAWVILENVPGLLSATCPCPGDARCERAGVAVRCTGELHSVPEVGACPGGCIATHGGVMGAVTGSLAERGYGFAYRVLDAQHFGVPQRRRRVVIVGRLGDTGTAPARVLLEPESSSRDSAPVAAPGRAVARALTARAGATFDDQQTGQLIVGAVTAKWAKGSGGPAGDETQNLVAGAGRGTPSDIAPTVSGQDAHGVATETTVRRLTPLECERLQGFPDNWTAGQADTHRYRQMGNAVAVPVFAWVGGRVVAEHLRRLQ